MPDPSPRPSPWLLFVPAAILFALALYQAVAHNNFPDFFIYRAGSEMGLRGHSPYDPAALRAEVERQFPDAKDLAANNGYFQPPGGVVVYAPFAAVPYPAAKVLWAVVVGLSAGAVLLLPRLFRDPPDPDTPTTPVVGMAVGFALLLNPLAIAVVIVGQTTLLFVGCVAAGQWAWEKGRPVAAALMWAVPFVKPHLALPLVPLAFALGGGRRAVGLVAAVGVLNLAGCLLIGGSPLVFRDYLTHLADGHKAVAFNRVWVNGEANPHVASWNRLYLAATGNVVELGAVETLAGYAVWGALSVVRSLRERSSLNRSRSERTTLGPSAAWAVAAAAVGMVVCCQVLAYELLVLGLLAPYIRDLVLGRRWGLVAAIGVCLGAQFVPAEAFGTFGCHRAAAVAGLAAVVLVGPVRIMSSAPPLPGDAP